MSYAADVKKELTSLDVHKNNARAELSAILKMNGVLNIQNQQLLLSVQTENPAIARRVFSLLKQVYKIEAQVVVRKNLKFNRNNVYLIKLNYSSKHIIDDLQLISDGQISNEIPNFVLADDICTRSYLRGAFLAGGSVNDPDKNNYHLEIYSLYEEHAQKIKKLINGYNLNSRLTKRRNGYIVYIKEAEKISNFLTLIGATNAMLKFEDIRIVRDMRNSVNRLVNCETANMSKIASASSKQISNIKFIDEKVGINNLPEKLRVVANLRLNNAEVSLQELCDLMPNKKISKSGMNHRLRKINEYADKLRENV